MKNRWLLYFVGYVRIRITGEKIEAFLTEPAYQKVVIWKVRKNMDETVTCCTRVQDILKWRKLRRKHNCSWKILSKHGMLFHLKLSLFVTLLSGWATIFLLSNILWDVQITGGDARTTYELVKQLEKLDIREGNFLFSLAKPEIIQQQLTDALPQITWIGVERKGTVLHFQVVESKRPKPSQKRSPQNLIAKKEATITKIYVENGKAMVKEHEHVKKGQLLISGNIAAPDAKEKQWVFATGEVYGETWHEVKITVPLTSQFTVYTGDTQERNYLKWGDWLFQFSGFAPHHYKQYEESFRLHDLYFLKWKLPITYKQTMLRETEEMTRHYTEEEAQDIAFQMGEKEIRQKVGKGAIIKEKKVLHRKIVSDKVEMTIYFAVEENIATARSVNTQ